MNRLEGKSQVNRLACLFACTYMVSYITRINYGAIISEMEAATAVSRDLLSMALTGSFITYGAGQIVSGVLGDRISPKKLVSCGLMVTVAMNLLIPVCRNTLQMVVVWCINGFSQNFLGPPSCKADDGAFIGRGLQKNDREGFVGKLFRDHAALSAIAAYHFGPQLEMGFCFFGNLRHRDACCMESLFL